jgi:hypothetical protein
MNVFAPLHPIGLISLCPMNDIVSEGNVRKIANRLLGACVALD